MRIFCGLLLWMAICTGVLAQGRSRILKPTALQRDLELLQTALTSLHPDLYRYQTREEHALRFAAARLKGRQPMSERRFFLLLSQLTAHIQDGRTRLSPQGLPDSVARTLLPQRVVPVFFEVVEGDRILITHGLCTQPELKRGDELLAVNGVPVGQIIDSLRTVAPQYGPKARAQQRAHFNETPELGNAFTLFDLYFPLFFGAKKDFLLTIKPLKGKTFTKRAEGLTVAQRMKLYESRCGRLPDDETGWTYKVLDDQTAYLHCGMLTTRAKRRRPEAFIDSVLADLAKRPQIKGLIVDIRGNAGNNEVLANYLRAGLAADTLKARPWSYRLRALTISDTIRPHIANAQALLEAYRDTSRYVRSEDGGYVFTVRPGGPARHAEPYTGRVALLVDAGTRNAAAGLAQALKGTGQTLVIGDETGPYFAQGVGEQPARLRLPGSGFMVEIALEAPGHAGKDGGQYPAGVNPDKEVRKSANDVKQDRDPQLAYARQQLTQ